MSRLRLVGLAVTAGLLSAPVGTSADLASRIVDRTLLCTMTGVGYPDPVRILEVRAATHDPATVLPASVSGTNGGSGDRGTGVTVITGFDDQPYKSYVGWRGATCATSKLVVPLSRQGLTGGAVDFYRQYNCEVPPKIVIRIRGIFERPATVASKMAKGSFVYGYLAAATTDRKPIFFASMNGATQQARIFVAKSRVAKSRCQEDS